MKDIVVIPTYNERENILHVVPLIFSTVPEIFVLVVDDNSPDGTGLEVIRLKKNTQIFHYYGEKRKKDSERPMWRDSKRF